MTVAQSGARPLAPRDDNEREFEFSNEDFIRVRQRLYDHAGISLAEHNGAYTAVFKNLLDWISVMEGKAWQQKPVLLMSTSPGPRGAIMVLRMAENYFPHMGAEITGTYSLGGFMDNFDPEKGVVNDEKLEELKTRVIEFEAAVLKAS